jgi:hypothetical protein
MREPNGINQFLYENAVTFGKQQIKGDPAPQKDSVYDWSYVAEMEAVGIANAGTCFDAFVRYKAMDRFIEVNSDAVIPLELYKRELKVLGGLCDGSCPEKDKLVKTECSKDVPKAPLDFRTRMRPEDGQLVRELGRLWEDQ